jgi:hypothetical protein
MLGLEDNNLLYNTLHAIIERYHYLEICKVVVAISDYGITPRLVYLTLQA